MNYRSHTLRPHLVLAASLALCLLKSAPARDLDYTGAASAAWNNTGNWLDGAIPTVPADGDTLVFDTLTTSNLSSTNDLVSLALAGLVVGSPGGNIVAAGNALSVGAGGFDLSSATRNFTLNVTETTLTANQSWNVAASRILQFNQLAAAAGVVIDLDGPGRVYIKPLVVGNTSPNFSGTFNLNAGTLDFDRADSTWGNNFVINANGGKFYFSVGLSGGSRTVDATLKVNTDTTIDTGTGSVLKVFRALQIGDSTLTLQGTTPDVQFNAMAVSGQAVLAVGTGEMVRLQSGALTEVGGSQTLTVRGGGTLRLENLSSNTLTGSYRLEEGSRILIGTNGGSTIGSGGIVAVNGRMDVSTNTSTSFNRPVEILGSFVLNNSNNGLRNRTFSTLAMDAGTAFSTEHTGPTTAGTSTFTFGNPTFRGGAADITLVNPTNATTTGRLVLGNTWNRQNRATVHFAIGSQGQLSSNPAALASNGVLGFATVNDSFAALVGGNVVALATYSPLAAGPLTATANYEATGGVVVDPNQTINALRLANPAPATLDLNSGTLALQSGGLLFTGTADFAVANGQLGADNAELIVHQRSTANLTISAAIAGASANGQLTKTGPGTLTLDAPQSFGGTTQVNQGILALSGTGSLTGDILLHAAGTLGLAAATGNAYTLPTGATLSGLGTVALGNTDLTLAGTVSPGVSPGELTFTSTGGNLIVGPTGLLQMEIDGFAPGEYDTIALTGGMFVAGGTLELLNLFAGTPEVGTTLQLFEVDGNAFSGSFASILNTSLGDKLFWDTSNLLVDGTLSLIMIPEPTSALLLALAALAARRHRRLPAAIGSNR